MSEAPKVEIGENGLQGWDEFDEWARYNLSSWLDATRTAKYYNMDEEDRLRLLSWMLANQLERIKQEYTYHLGGHGIPRSGP